MAVQLAAFNTSLQNLFFIVVRAAASVLHLSNHSLAAAAAARLL